MKKIKILNLYAGIGGNRKLWPEKITINGIIYKIEVTAIENNKLLATIYKDFFPNDDVIIDDAHEYLLKNYKDFDFIWSSRPCQSHSSFRYNICVRYRETKPVYPDFGLYEEIIFLKYHFKGYWVAENVNPYYKEMENPKKIQRHLFWSNFNISDIDIQKDVIRRSQIPDLQKKYGIDLSQYSIKNKRQVLRNCVVPELGLHIFKEYIKQLSQSTNQASKP